MYNNYQEQNTNKVFYEIQKEMLKETFKMMILKWSIIAILTGILMGISESARE